MKVRQTVQIPEAECVEGDECQMSVLSPRSEHCIYIQSHGSHYEPLDQKRFDLALHAMRVNRDRGVRNVPCRGVLFVSDLFPRLSDRQGGTGNRIREADTVSIAGKLVFTCFVLEPVSESIEVVTELTHECIELPRFRREH